MRLFWAVVFGCASSVAMAEAHQGQAHEHGVAEMNLVVAGQEMLIEVSSPAHNVFGFEHAPHTEAQKHMIQQQLSGIRAGRLFAPNAEAKCHFALQDLKNPFHLHDSDKQDHSAHEHEHEHEHEHDHKNVMFEVHYRCDDINALQLLDARAWFQQWPQLETVRVQTIVNQHQSAATLRANQARLALTP